MQAVQVALAVIAIRNAWRWTRPAAAMPLLVGVTAVAIVGVMASGASTVLVHHDLLILDELGDLPQDTRAADLLDNVIARRHERASTIITTSLAYKQWGAIFQSAACVGALVDRRSALP